MIQMYVSDLMLILFTLVVGAIMGYVLWRTHFWLDELEMRLARLEDIIDRSHHR